MRVVVDTNVLVSGLLSPYGSPGVVVALIAAGHLTICYDARILAKYADVLGRPAFSFSPAQVEALLAQIESLGELVASSPLPVRLPDPDDEPFLEVAVASFADCLLTGNGRHYPKAARQDVAIVTPREFTDGWLRRPP